MATYRADLVQNIQPATADYQALARSTELRGQADVNLLKVLGEVGVSAYKAYQAEDIKSTATGAMVKNEKGELVESNTDLLNAQELTEAFLTRNQAANKASLLETEARQLAGQQYTYASELEGSMPYEAQQRDIAQFEAAKAQTLTQYSTEIQRLKEASKGGMSKEEYVSRVSAITKKAIAKYPHMSDEIRQQVGIVTGLPYADRWAQMQYVKDAFTKSTKVDKMSPDEMAVKDIAGMAALGTYGSQEELTTLRTTNPGEYERRRTAYNQFLASQTRTKAIETEVKGLQAASDADADKHRAMFGAIFSGALSTNVLSSVVVDKEKVYEQTAQLMAKGENLSVNAAPFKVQIDMHVATMQSNIRNAHRAANVQLDAYFEKNPNITDAKRNEMRKDIDRARDVMLEKYATQEGLSAMATILSNYRDKTIEEQNKLVSLVISQQNAMQNNPLVMAYWQGGEKRENLKAQFPDFYAFMKQQEEVLTGTVGMIRDEVGAGQQLARTASKLEEATRSPAPMQMPDYEIGDPTQYKIVHQAMMGSAQQNLEKLNLGQSLDTQQVNIISSAFATSAQYGANANQLMNRHQEFYKSLSKLPASQLAIVKENVNTGAKEAITQVTRLKKELEEKYGMTINLGLNSMGEIAPIVRAEDVRNSKAREMLSEFTKASRPLIRTAIFARAAVTGEEPRVGGQAFLTAITNNTPPEDFFSLGGAGRGVSEGSPGITNYDYATGEVKRPSIYSGTQAEREAYDEQQRKKIADNIAKMEGKQSAGEAPKPAPQEDTGPVSIKDDIEQLSWLNKRQKDTLYKNIVRAVKDGSLTNLTRFAQILQTATEEERKKLVESLK